MINVNWEWQELEKDRDYGMIVENRYRDQNRPLPQMEFAGDSYFSAKYLTERIEDCNRLDWDSFTLVDFAESLPALESVEQIVEAVELKLGLFIELDNASTGYSNEVKLVFSWH